MPNLWIDGMSIATTTMSPLAWRAVQFDRRSRMSVRNA